MPCTVAEVQGCPLRMKCKWCYFSLEALYCMISRTWRTIARVLTCVAALQLYFSQVLAQCQTKVMRLCNDIMKPLAFFGSHFNLTFQVVRKQRCKVLCLLDALKHLFSTQRAKLHFFFCNKEKAVLQMFLVLVKLRFWTTDTSCW